MGRSLHTIGDNERAREIAKKHGYSSAEDLKADFVEPPVSLYDICYDKSTKEIVIMNKKTGNYINTGLKLKE